MSVKETKNKKYDLVAPEGGWGYMICLAFILNMVTISSFVNCFGMTFKELFIELKMDSTSITLFNGINSFTIAMSGFMASSLLKYTSIRQLGLVGAFILNVGVLGTVFVKSKFQFFFCQAFLQSLGHGIIYNLSCTMLNNYFVKRRILAVSFTQTVVATTAFLTPLFVKWAMEMYGSRGTFLLISGVSLHSIFAMAVMQPVAWHMKRIEVPEDKENETKLLLVKDKKYVTNKEDLTASIKSYSKSENASKGTGENTYTVEENAKERSNRLKRFVHHVFDVSLFRTYLLSNACVGAALIMFTEMTFTLMVPQALYSMGWNENQVAWAVSLNALGDLVTRTLLIFMSSVLAKLGSNEVYVVGLAIAFGSRIGMLWSDNRTAMTTFMTIMGISRSSIMVLTNVVIADVVHQDQFSGAVGLFLLTFGVFNLTVGPVIGAVRDLTDSYTTAFYVLTSFYAIVLIFWSIELLYKKTKHKRQPKTDISSKP